jgi:hypothetical protein
MPVDSDDGDSGRRKSFDILGIPVAMNSSSAVFVYMSTRTELKAWALLEKRRETNRTSRSAKR